MANKPRVLICEFFEETDSFNPIVWDIARFKSILVCRGLVMRVVQSALNSTVKGMLMTVRDYGGKAHTGVCYRAGAGGLVDGALLTRVIDETLDLIKRKGPFDAVLLSLHGASVATDEQDACGKYISAVRCAAKNAVIGVSLDLHANVTEKMRANADFICGYNTYPHIDFFETGCRTAELVMKKLAGEELYEEYSTVPLLVPPSGYTTSDGAFYDVMKLGFNAKPVDFTVFPVQPWLDVDEIASCAAVVDTSPEKARELAQKLSAALWDARHGFEPALTPVDDIISAAGEAARAKKGKPVILADASDSPNGGCPGDSVYVLTRLIELGSSLKAAVCVNDPAASDRAFALGIGKRAEFTLGGAYTKGLMPITLECEVVSLHGGKFTLKGPAGKGLRVDMGKCAVLRHGNIDILVCRTPAGSGDVNFYAAFGIKPWEYELVCVKANTSFRGAYAPFCDKIFVADTPGAGSARLASMPFERLKREGMYPFCEE